MESVDILINIRKIIRAITLESKAIEKEYGLTIPQFLSLRHLAQKPNYQITQKDLKGLLSLNSSTVTGIVNRLVKRGYVVRLPKSGDKRVTHITLTAAGLKLLEKVPNVLHNRLLSKLDKLTNEEKDMVDKALNIITNALDINNVDASPLLMSDTDIS